jgi:hypothetical protein
MSVALGAAAAGACGGKVVVDRGTSGGPNGQGGQGGASTTTVGPITSTTTGTGFGGSVGTGPTCDCTSVCGKVVPCGVSASVCMSACSQFSASQRECVCSTPSCPSILQCFGIATGGTGTTGTGFGTGAGGGSMGDAQCRGCVQKAAMGPCAMQLQACQANPDCAAIIQCHQQCGFGPMCMGLCEGQHPNGTTAFAQLIDCSACQICAAECATLPAILPYCLPPPPPPGN